MSSLDANLSISSIAFVFAGLALAGIIKGATGLGYASTALPFLVHAVGLNTGIALVLLPAMATNIAVAFGNGYLRETCHDYSALYLAMLPGIGAGLLLLAHIEAGVAVKSLGVTILVYSILSLLRPRLVLTPPAAARLQVPVGLANGLLTGLTGSQVLPMVPYFLALDLEPKRMVQAINLGVTLASAILLGGLLLSGQAPLLVLRASALAIVPALSPTGVDAATTALQPLVPARLLETRPGFTTSDGQGQLGHPITTTHTLQVTGRGNVPTDATAAALTLTATGTNAPGYLTVYPCHTGRPLSSHLNFDTATTIATTVVTQLSPTGTACIFASATTHLIVDVNGSFDTTAFQGLTPARLLDTRTQPTVDGIGSGTGIVTGVAPSASTTALPVGPGTRSLSPARSEGWRTGLSAICSACPAWTCRNRTWTSLKSSAR